VHKYCRLLFFACKIDLIWFERLLWLIICTNTQWIIGDLKIAGLVCLQKKVFLPSLLRLIFWWFFQLCIEKKLDGSARILFPSHIVNMVCTDCKGARRVNKTHLCKEGQAVLASRYQNKLNISCYTESQALVPSLMYNSFSVAKALCCKSS
jgi:hypothetical protein